MSANLAYVLADMGRLPEAEALCNETLEQQRKVLGAEHPDVLFTTVLLASIEVRQGRKQAGLDHLRQAVDAGFADPDTIRKEPGLQALADDPEFKRLVEVVTKRAEK
jgi:hypothetical protein